MPEAAGEHSQLLLLNSQPFPSQNCGYHTDCPKSLLANPRFHGRYSSFNASLSSVGFYTQKRKRHNLVLRHIQQNVLDNPGQKFSIKVPTLLTPTASKTSQSERPNTMPENPDKPLKKYGLETFPFLYSSVLLKIIPFQSLPINPK